MIINNCKFIIIFTKISWAKWYCTERGSTCGKLQAVPFDQMSLIADLNTLRGFFELPFLYLAAILTRLEPFAYPFYPYHSTMNFLNRILLNPKGFIRGSPEFFRRMVFFFRKQKNMCGGATPLRPNPHNSA